DAAVEVAPAHVEAAGPADPERRRPTDAETQPQPGGGAVLALAALAARVELDRERHRAPIAAQAAPLRRRPPRRRAARVRVEPREHVARDALAAARRLVEQIVVEPLVQPQRAVRPARARHQLAAAD